MARPRVYTKLSPYQERILQLLYTRMSVPEIATLLGRPSYTIYNVIREIQRKTGTRKRYQIMGRRIEELETQLRNLTST